ncbi:MAG: AsmA family protein, partial [Terriglobia bacterium]
MASQWHQSKLVRVGAVLLALLLVVLLALPYLLDIDRYRPAITDALKKQTGREVEIESLRLHFLPSLRVSVSNVRLKNPKGFPDGDTVTIGSIDVGLAFRPLLSGQVEITSVTLGAIEVNLLTDARGRTNYASLLNPPRSSRKKAAAAEEETSWSLARVDSVALEDITITSGTFRRRNKRVYPMWAATGINVRAQGFDFTSNNWREKMTARIDLTPIKFTSPSLKEPLRFTDGEVEVKGNAARGNLTAALGPLRAQGSVRMANLAKPVAVFTLSMKELDVASLRQVLGPGPEGEPKPPGGRSGQGLLARGTVKVGRVIVSPLSAEKVDAKVRIYADRLEVNPFSFSFYRGAAKGTLGVKLDDQALPARVNATVQGVEVARL